jgi:hypothetical protein
MTKETSERIQNITTKTTFKFGSETWILKKRDEQRVQTSQNNYLRYLFGITQLLILHGYNDVRQTEIHAAEPLMSEPSILQVEVDIAKLKRHKSPVTDQIPAELIKAGGSTICSEVHKLINSIWNEEELPEQWKKSVIVPVYKKGDKKTVVTITLVNYIQNSKNVLLSRLTLYTEEIIGELQCGFRRNRPTTDRIFCI